MKSPIDEEDKIPPDNLFLMRYIKIQRKTHPHLKMIVNGKQVDIENFLEVDISKNKRYVITFEI